MTYNIQINESQRKLIERALGVALADPLFQIVLLQEKAEPGWLEDSAFDSLHNLREAFMDMVGEESERPGMIHGLCV